MAKDFTKNILAFIAVVVIGYIAFTMFSGGQIGFAAADTDTCRGSPILILSPSTVQAGDNIVASVANLEGCADKIVHIKDGDCNANTIVSYTCDDSRCSRRVAFQKNVVGTTLISACVDKNNNDWFFDPEERSTASLTVTTVPDLVVSEVTFDPEKPTNRQTVKVIATIKNVGALAAMNADVKCKIVEVGKSAPIYEEIKTADLPIKGEADITFRGVSLTSGEYNIEIIADPDERRIDFDRSDNEYTTTLTVV